MAYKIVRGRIYAMAGDIRAAVKLHTAGEGHAKTLIAAGHYDVSSAWSFSADDGNKLLGGADGANWTAYANMHLGEDADASANTRARYEYPFGKDGKVYLSALNAIDSRATTNKETDIDDAAKRLKAAIKEKEDAKGGKKASWYRFTAADVSTDPAQLYVYDEIGGFGVSVEDFVRDLKALGDAKQITMHVNSPGGDAFAGVAMHNVLAAHPANITCCVDGYAASAASLLCMAADKIVMPENTFMVVHHPYGATVGPFAAHQSMADDLKGISDSYAATYAKRSGQPLDAVMALMAEDRLMGAAECKAKGYCDEVMPAKLMAATYDLDKVPGKFRGKVAGLYEKSAETVTPPAAAAATPPAAAATPPAYGMGEIEQTLALCAVAKMPALAAHKFIAAKTPIGEVRKALMAAAASEADAAEIERVDTTQADVGVANAADVDRTRANGKGKAGQHDPTRPADPKIQDSWKAAQKRAKAEMTGKKPAK